MEYASNCWARAAKTKLGKLDKFQQMGLRTSLGATRSSPIKDMEKTADFESLGIADRIKLLLSLKS